MIQGFPFKGSIGSIKTVLPEICRYWEFVNLCFAGG